MTWGLYEDLPPPSSSSLTSSSSASPSVQSTTSSSSQSSSSSDLSEWSSTPKLLKLMAPAVRKKAPAPMVPRAALASVSKPKSSIASPKPAASATTTSSSTDTKTIQNNNNNSGSGSNNSSADSSHSVQNVTTESLHSTFTIPEADQYDPSYPNEYEHYLAEKSHSSHFEDETRRFATAAAIRERELAALEKTQEAERQAAPQANPSPSTINLNISGEEAFMRRARMSGKALPPPPPPRSPSPPAKVVDDDDIDGVPIDDEIDGKPWENPGEKKPTVKEDTPNFGSSGSVAARMMAKMGWKGQGLGKSEQGITTPLLHKKTDWKSGVIVAAPQPPQLALPPEKKARPTSSIPLEKSCIVLLANMVGPGEVDDELESETASECTKYGEVVKCVIFEVVGGKVPPEKAVRIFVQFSRQEAALKAYIDLNGRYFGGRTVNASFYNEERFFNNDLAPRLDEM